MARAVAFKPKTIISESLAKLDDIPLLYGGPAFPKDKIAGTLASIFEIEGLVIEMGDAETLEGSARLSGIGKPITPELFTVSGMHGQIALLLPDSAYNTLMEWLLLKEAGSGGINDPDIQAGFRYFFIAQLLNSLSQLSYPEGHGIERVEGEELDDAPCIGISFTLRFKEQALSGRVLLSDALVLDWRAKYGKKNKAPIDPEVAKSLNMTLRIECGSADINLQDWEGINQGDILILDQCTVDPVKGSGRVRINLEGKTLFHAEVSPKGDLTLAETIS